MAYRTRPIRFLQRWEHESWRIKMYGISAWDDRPPDELVKTAQTLAAATLPAPALADGRHGVGFMGVHDGAQACFVFVSWWAKVYELNHVLFRGARGAKNLAPVEAGLFGCTWDLHVIAFERDAWIGSMAGPQDGPNLDTYLAATFNAHV